MHWSRISRTQSGFITRAPGPDSPPTMTQSIPSRFNAGNGPKQRLQGQEFHLGVCLAQQINSVRVIRRYETDGFVGVVSPCPKSLRRARGYWRKSDDRESNAWNCHPPHGPHAYPLSGVVRRFTGINRMCGMNRMMIRAFRGAVRRGDTVMKGSDHPTEPRRYGPGSYSRQTGYA